jgi:hypothetical protein
MPVRFIHLRHVVLVTLGSPVGTERNDVFIPH